MKPPQKQPHVLSFFVWRLLGRKNEFFPFLLHEDWEIRKDAMASLDRIDPQWPQDCDCVPQLISALGSPNAYLRDDSARILGLIGDPTTVPHLIDILDDAIAGKSAADALTRIDPKWSEREQIVRRIPGMIDLAINKDGKVRGEAEEILVRIDANWLKRKESHDKIPEFLSALTDNEPYVRRAAFSLLEKINPSWPKSEAAGAFLPEYITALKNSANPHVRKQAALILGMIADQRALPPLIDALKDEHGEVCEEVGRALTEINPQWRKHEKAGALFLECMEMLKRKKNIGRAAAALVTLGDTRALLPLIEALKQPYESDQFVLPVSLFNNQEWRKALKRLVALNQPFVNDYPHLYCTECRCRAASIRKYASIAQIGIANFKIVFCPICQGCENMLTGIRHVTGVIGGEMIDLRRIGYGLEVSLWNEQEKKARNADVDTFVIRNGGVRNYHQAVNAVIIELTSDATKPRDRLKKIRTYPEDDPPLPKDVVRILKDTFDWDS